MRKVPGQSFNTRFYSKKSLSNQNIFNQNFQESSIKSNFEEKNFSKIYDVKNKNFSFYLDRLDDYTGFFSTQQLENLDFSKLENHVFFDSAVSKINYTFKRIVNEFPYDKANFEFEQYIKKNDGYTTYLLNKKFPKNLGYLSFTGTNFIFLKDKAGSIFNNPPDKKTTYGFLDPGIKNFTLDFWIKCESENQNQIILQKLYNNSDGYSVYLSDYDNNTIKLNILYTREDGFIHSFIELPYNEWSHINLSINKQQTIRFFTFYLNGKIIESKTSGNISYKKSKEEFKKSDVTIGFGEIHNNIIDSSLNLNSITSFIGKLDNLRVFRRRLSKEEIIFSKDNNLRSTSEMILNYSFNEPPGNYVNNQIVLDHSGNKLDSIIKNVDGSFYTSEQISQFRIKKINSDSHIKYEKEEDFPVLFPSFDQTINLQKVLLEEAKRYDKFNPNVFWKLMPTNLFKTNSGFENLESDFVNTDPYTAVDISKKIQTPASNQLINIVSVWAKFFDQLKLYIDCFTEVINLDYDSINKEKTLGMFLPTMVNLLGFEFRDLLPSSLKTKLDKKNLSHEEIYSENSIRFIQNELWKRFLINSQDFLRSKGTKNSVRSVFNSMGLDYNKFISIREFNGSNTLNSQTNYTNRLQKYNFLDFGSKKMINFKNKPVFSSNNNLIPDNKFILEIKDDNNNFKIENDWCIEFFVKYNNNMSNLFNKEQNIFRINRKSGWSLQNNNYTYLPLISIDYKQDENNEKHGSLVLKITEGLSFEEDGSKKSENSFIKKDLTIENVSLFSGSEFYISINKKNIKTNLVKYQINFYSSKYPYDGSKVITREAIFIINEKEKSSNIESFTVGELNNFVVENEVVLNNNTKFEGQIHSIKFWQKFLKDEEIFDHKFNFRNFGSSNPEDIYTNSSENILLNVDLREKFISVSNESINTDIAGHEFLLNNSINNSFFESKIKVNSSATLDQTFDSIEEIIKSNSKVIQQNNIKIDEPVNNDCVNINYFDDEYFNSYYKIKNSKQKFHIDSNFEYFNDARCSIDFSNINFINNEISNLISQNEYFSKILGNSSNRFKESYEKIDKLRDKFFQKYEENIDYKPLYQVYKYFDNILTDLLYSTIPGRVNYLGFNFVYESHALERNKYLYKMNESNMSIVDSPLSQTSDRNIVIKNNIKTSKTQRNIKNESGVNSIKILSLN